MESRAIDGENPIQKIECVETIKESCLSRVYRVNNKFIAKTYLDVVHRCSPGYEFEIADRLRSEGVSVPKPFGVAYLRLNGKKGSLPYFIMEYINGKTFTEIECHPVVMGEVNRKFLSKRSELIDRMFKEIDKAERAGFSIHDSGSVNTLWDWQKDEIYLIDFEQWVFFPWD